MRKLFVVPCLVVLGLASAASAQITLVIPTSADPGTVANNLLTTLGTYMPQLVLFVMVIALILAFIKRMRRAPHNVTRGSN